MKSKTFTAIKPPKLPAEEDCNYLTTIDFADEKIINGFSLYKADLSGQAALMLTLESGILERVGLQNQLLKKSRLADLRVDTCDISNAIWSDCKISRVVFMNCKLTGLKLTESRLSDVVFENCVGDMVQLCSTEFKKVCFKNCRLTGVDLRFSDLQEAVFDRCDLQQAILYDAKMQGADLRGSQLNAIKANAPDLKGAIIDVRQSIDLAGQLANMLGIQLKNE